MNDEPGPGEPVGGEGDVPNRRERRLRRPRLTRSPAPGPWKLFLGWILATLAGTLIGSFAGSLAQVVQFVVYLVPPSQLDSAWMRAYESFTNGLSGVLAEAIAGFCLGIIQVLIIRRWVATRRWVAATVIGYLLVVPLNYAVGLFLGPSGNLWAAGFVALRAGDGLLRGAGQGFGLRRGAGDAGRWALATAAAWVLWTFAGRYPPIQQQPGAISIVGLVAGVVVIIELGVIQGVTTGFLLAHWSRRWTEEARRRRRGRMSVRSLIRTIADAWHRFESWPGHPADE